MLAMTLFGHACQFEGEVLGFGLVLVLRGMGLQANPTLFDQECCSSRALVPGQQGATH